MLTRLNAGWTYTVLALITVVFSVPAILAERRWGMKWRQEREERARMKKERNRQAIENAEGQAKA
jgi:hypothetical protein